jgi:poly-beta-1,6-N-acetyl-D-glucosamine biosynthesis protein PgaD
MAQKLIINARSDLSWRRRVLSDLATAGLWAFWIVLWWPVFRKLYHVIRLHEGLSRGAIQVFRTITPISLTHSSIALLGTCALLLLWTLLPTRKLTHAHDEEMLADYSDYFDLDEGEILAGRESRVCVVRHDEHGRIVGIEPRD